jgi:transposase
MIGLSRALRVYAYAAPVDMRKAYEGLSAIVRNELRRDVMRGELFLFVSKNRRRAKVLLFDGTGLGLYMKRMDKGRLAAPWERARDGCPVEMTLSELALFLEGSELIGRHSLSPSPLTQQELAVSIES